MLLYYLLNPRFDYYIEVWRQIVNEAYTNPDILKTAPHNTQINKIDSKAVEDPEKWTPTWRVYLKRKAISAR